MKTRLAKAINNLLDPIRERRVYFSAHPKISQDVLTNGIRRMQAEARETMEIVRTVTGLSYSTEMFVDEIDLFGEYDG